MKAPWVRILPSPPIKGEEMPKEPVYKLQREDVELSDEMLDRINKTHQPYVTVAGDACYIVDGTEIGKEPGEYLIWGV